MLRPVLVNGKTQMWHCHTKCIGSEVCLVGPHSQEVSNVPAVDDTQHSVSNNPHAKQRLEVLLEDDFRAGSEGSLRDLMYMVIYRAQMHQFSKGQLHYWLDLDWEDLS